MLYAGIIAGPLYVLVSLIEVIARDGFDPRRHAWSQLANGDLGWIHSANLIVAGLLVVLGAIGWRRMLRSRAWAFLAGYDLSMVAAGVFRADAGNPPRNQAPASFATRAARGLTSHCPATWTVGTVSLPSAMARTAAAAAGSSQMLISVNGTPRRRNRQRSMKQYGQPGRV
jgi:hypothetical protein